MTVASVDKDPEHLTLVLVAEFAAPVERVWQLWADPRQLERWWGPPSHPSTVEEHDLAPGGAVTYFMTGPDGETSRGWWRVTAVDPPRVARVHRRLRRRATARRTPTCRRPRSRVRLAEQDGVTRMELRFTFDSAKRMKQLEEWGAFEVFPQSVAPDGRRRSHGRQPNTRRPPMRKIKSNFFISLDGVVESPDQWHFPYFDDEMGAAVGAASRPPTRC